MLFIPCFTAGWQCLALEITQSHRIAVLLHLLADPVRHRSVEVGQSGYCATSPPERSDGTYWFVVFGLE